jgi:hypothetical protein
MLYHYLMHHTRLFAIAALAACSACTAEKPAADASAASSAALDSIAEPYVKLVLAMGKHDADYVDAYYGPPEWKAAADSVTLPLDSIASRTARLRAAADSVPQSSDRMLDLRAKYLRAQLGALATRVSMLQGKKYSFDEESRELYNAVSPSHPESYYQQIVDSLGAILPGAGTVSQRYDRYRSAFIIPPAKLDTVFRTAIAECKARTLRHTTLPPEEKFTLEYVTNKSWSGYNWYKGGFNSLIQVNTDLPIYIDRAVDLACHEGYPGHHVYNALLEQKLVKERGWQEYTVYPLFSPQSLIAEGSANYGIDMAFPGRERLEYERAALWPLAGLDSSKAEQYYAIADLVGKLSYAGNEAARKYLDGQMTSAEAATWLEKYGLYAPARAAQRMRFVDQYRSYVINYNLGKDLVREYVEKTGGSDPAKRWDAFISILTSPILPGSLK